MTFITFGTLSPVKPCLVKHFKWLLKVITGKGLQRAHFVFRPVHKGHLWSTSRSSCRVIFSLTVCNER